MSGKWYIYIWVDESNTGFEHLRNKFNAIQSNDHFVDGPHITKEGAMVSAQEIVKNGLWLMPKDINKVSFLLSPNIIEYIYIRKECDDLESV